MIEVKSMPTQHFTAQMYNAFLGRALERNGCALWISLHSAMIGTAFINGGTAT
ncbi:conserved hypothetical protein [Hyphomicrobiales bacterium]|nr:conserved hypothetical protein [Hyphomicrobiales bacterium]CAH1694981.1 conserved hypothetical protein [Hyphomicrobiales bacterium]